MLQGLLLHPAWTDRGRVLVGTKGPALPGGPPGAQGGLPLQMLWCFFTSAREAAMNSKGANFWSGHAQTHVSERYIKLLRDRDYRLEWAEKIGIGFELPGCSGGEKLAKPRQLANLANSFSSEKPVKSFESGGREGIRTPGLLIANEEKSKIRCGTTIT